VPILSEEKRMAATPSSTPELRPERSSTPRRKRSKKNESGGNRKRSRRQIFEDDVYGNDCGILPVSAMCNVQ